MVNIGQKKILWMIGLYNSSDKVDRIFVTVSEQIGEEVTASPCEYFYICIYLAGINHLCSHLTKHSRGLVLLNLSHTGMTSRGVNRLAEALCSNKYIAASLKTLNLSGNNIKAEDITVSNTQYVLLRHGFGIWKRS